jgi:WD40 repeat protein
MTNRYECARKEIACRPAMVAALIVLASIPLGIISTALGQDTPDPVSTASEPQPPKNCHFRQLRFSPDGRYILAQQASGIAVLSVQPLSVLFSRSAENVSNAGFTPDSEQVWFVSRPSHVIAPQIAFAGSSAFVERWNIAGATRVDMKETRLRKCVSSGVSPDSRFLACVDSGGTLRVVDVDSGETVFEKRKFSSIGDRGIADFNFSPDSRYIAAVPKHIDGGPLAWDLRAKEQVKLGGRLKKLDTGYHLAFVASDQIMISSVWLGTTTVNATLVEFPSGKMLSKAKLPPGQLFQAADPAFVLIRPFGRTVPGSNPAQKSSAVEFRTGQVIMSDAEALDVFGTHFIMELPDGKLGLGERGKGVQASVAIDPR